MNRFLLAIGLFIHAINAIAQPQKVTGIVKDAITKLPLSNAMAIVNNRVLITDDDGKFSFTAANSSKLTVSVSLLGYETFSVPITSNMVVILLRSKDLFLQPLEVKSLRAANRAPFTKTNISKEEIAKHNLGQDLPFLLQQTPGVVANSDAGNGIGYTAMRIRGTDATRINMTINGIPYNDAESQGSFLVNIPDIASSLSSLQIQRGVGTSSNGSGAFGATLNLSTNEHNEKAYAEFNNSAGSFNSWKNTIKAGSGLINNHFTIDARLSQVSSNGFIDRAKTKLQSFYLSTAYLNKSTAIRFNIISGKEKTYLAWNGVPENLIRSDRSFNNAGTEKPGTPYENETDNYQQDHYQLFINQSINQQWSLNTAFFLTNGRGYYEQYKAKRKFSSVGLPNAVIGGTTITKTDLIRQLWLDNAYYGQIFSANYKDNLNEINIGGGWNSYDGDHFGKVIWAEVGIPKDHKWYDLFARKTDINAYVKWRRKLSENWDLFTDLQWRNVLYNMNGFRDNPTLLINRKFNFLNPKAGITYHKNNLQAYVSFAVANKEPNRDDFEAGAVNQPLHETLIDTELGIEEKGNRYQWAVTLYHMQYKNQLVLTGKVNDVGAYTRINIPNSYRAGIEIQGAYSFNNWLDVKGNICFSNNRIKSFTEYIDDYDNSTQKTIGHRNTDIAFSPNITSNLNIQFKPLQSLEVNAISRYIGRQYLDNTSTKTRSLNAFYVQDLQFVYTPLQKAVKKISIVLQLNNIWNKMYEPNGYTFSYITGGALTTENYYYPMAGFNFMSGLQIAL